MTGSLRPEDGATEGKPLSGAGWLQAAPLRRVLDVLEKAGGSGRVVGGAVRNALLGHPISDLDIATPLLPQEVMQCAAVAGLGVHPTGIEHGTVTVVADGHPFEVTTLRRDVETDGRRAVVAFSQDWREDAARRDFTINALYCTRDGAVFDYFGGLDDLRHKRVRFIGGAEQRIREDYLRILRFFRFNAQYGAGEPDAEGLAACIALKDGLARLSNERIGAETMKLMCAPRAADVIRVMAHTSILTAVLGGPSFPERLDRLVEIESAAGFEADALTRLAALALDGAAGASHLAEHLRLSNNEGDALARAGQRSAFFDPSTPEREARAHLYRVGRENFLRAALVTWAASGASPHDADRNARARLAQRWAIPALPARGADVLALGVPAGPKVGDILRAFELWWISADFPDDPAVQQRKLSALVRDSY